MNARPSISMKVGIAASLLGLLAAHLAARSPAFAAACPHSGCFKKTCIKVAATGFRFFANCTIEGEEVPPAHEGATTQKRGDLESLDTMVDYWNRTGDSTPCTSDSFPIEANCASPGGTRDGQIACAKCGAS